MSICVLYTWTDFSVRDPNQGFVMMTFLTLWVGHAFVAAIPTTPMVVLGRRRAAWEIWEALAFILPFWTWASLMLTPLGIGKSIANLGEPINFSVAIVAATVIRLVWGHRSGKRVLAVVLQMALVSVAVGTFFLTGPLPEVGIDKPSQPTSAARG